MVSDSDRQAYQASNLHNPNVYIFYRYSPSRPAAGVFVGLFTIITALHLVKMIRTRTWYFIPMVLGGVFEFVGYIGRIIAYKQRYALGPYIQQALLLLLAPALFAASIYMVMGRILRLLNAEKLSFIPVRFLTKLFVTADIINFLLQGSGGGVQAGSTIEAVHLGEKLIIAGLFVQVIFFGIFLVVVAIFDFRIRRHPTPKSLDPDYVWKPHIIALYTASALIFVRSIVRVIEYIQGNGGWIISHEWCLYVFDAMPMFGVLVVYYAVHPSAVDKKRAEDAKAGVAVSDQAEPGEKVESGDETETRPKEAPGSSV